MKNKSLLLAISLILCVLFIDQSLKIWIKTTMVEGQEIPILSWFKLHFVENEGMAFGMTLGGNYGKLALTLFRIVAVAFIAFWLHRLVRRPQQSMGFIASLSLILAGAIGNIIDSVWYGLLFSDSVGRVATFLPPDGGYAPLLHGKVVDMFWFPIWDGFLPHCLPIWGGTYFSFFNGIFNVADAAITVGVVLILLFQHQFFAHTTPTPPLQQAEV